MNLRPPSVDAVLRVEAVALLVVQHGRQRVVEAIRETLQQVRAALGAGDADALLPDRIAAAVAQQIGRAHV